MSEPTRRDFTTSALLAALGLSVSGGALAEPPAAEGMPETVVGRLKVSRRVGNEGVDCLPDDAPASPIIVELSVENTGDQGVELRALNRRVFARLDAAALLPDTEEPWSLRAEREGCSATLSRAVQVESRPLPPKTTLVLGTWRIRYPSDLATDGVSLRVGGRVQGMQGDLVIEPVTVPLPAAHKS